MIKTEEGRKLTEGEIKILLNNVVILIDTRENKNKHITDYLDKRGISWESYKLESGDYSIKTKVNENIGLPEISLENLCVVERKKTLDELIGNLTNGRERFFKEFERFSGKIVIAVEESSYKDVITQNYRSQMNPVALNNSIMKLSSDYGAEVVWFGSKKDKEEVAIWVLTWLKSQLKAFLRCFEITEE